MRVRPDSSTVAAADLEKMSVWNETVRLYSGAKLVHRLVEAQTLKTPNACAVEYCGEKLTYAELNAQANQLARHLRTLGVRPDTRVAICLSRGISMVVALIATLKADGAYLPLDPAYPDDRLQYMLRHGEPVVLLTESGLTSRFSALPEKLAVLNLEKNMSKWAHQSIANLESDETIFLQDENLAYVIYTSGSTGEPKGVAMPHKALVNLINWQLEQPDFDHCKRTVQFAALGFDVAFQEVFSTLCSGGTLVLLREETRLDPVGLFNFIAEAKIERLFLPFVALQLLAEGFDIDCRARKMPRSTSLKEVITAGEQLRISPSVSRFFSHLGSCRLINHYGPTESHVVTSYTLPLSVADWVALPPIGRPIANTQIHILDENRQPVPIGTAGEIYIAGACLARGYLNRAELTADRFVTNPFANSALMYKTGDQAKWLADGEIEYMGRNDFQVKIRGFRVELGEIESAMAAIDGIKDVAVVALDMAGDANNADAIKRLVAYYTEHTEQSSDAIKSLSVHALRSHLASTLPEYMVPAVYVRLASMPVTPNGKLDRRNLPVPANLRPELSVPYQSPVGSDERVCCEIFAALLSVDKVGRNDNFFELGGNSLLAMRALEKIRQATGRNISAPTIFAHPTAASLALAISSNRSSLGGTLHSQFKARNKQRPVHELAHEPIAIIGMSGRFPGANNVEHFWENLLANRDSITQFAADEIDPSIRDSLKNDPNYVRARGTIADVENFDAAFFSISAREAEVLDPQHRLLLEIAWECLERAGYAPNQCEQRVGVFAGVHSTTYLQNHVMANPDAIERIGEFQVMLGNEKDYVATRVAFKLNLKGPALNIQSACSTSLVAINQAVEQLRAGACDMALAGAAAVTAPHRCGYLYQEGAMLSADGHTKTFDESATGTVFSDGAAMVLLKPLAKAIQDGDQIFALINGVAINNDGGDKASFSAPSVVGQASVLAAAHADADIDPGSISYIEAHGTATPLGDPVEIEALTEAFRFGMSQRQQHQSSAKADVGFCRIGSVKSNVGHLVAASGAAGVIKVAMSLANEVLPATINFKKPNPKLELETSPFVVNHENSPWPRAAQVRRAGVSSFGVGGTNAHAVLEEPPILVASLPSSGAHWLRLSARSPAALDCAAQNLAQHLHKNPHLNLSDVAWTLDVGRTCFAHRLVVAADSVTSAASALTEAGHAMRRQRVLGANLPKLAFVFPGQGAQYAGMGRELYSVNEHFSQAFDACIAALGDTLSFDLKERMFSDDLSALTNTEVTQPATFCLEYALAQMWIARGAVPTLLVGHSVGEFVAAVLAGVMSLQDAVCLVAKRGALLQALPRGSMLSVRLAAAKLETRLPPDISLAADNGPNASVVAGPTEAVGAFASVLESEGVAVRLLQTSHAFHSGMMDKAVEPFLALVSDIKLSTPTIPMISTLTGKLLREEDAMDPAYWARHLRAPVRFSPAIAAALASRDGSDGELESTNVAFLEVGPRATLSTLIRQHSVDGSPALAVASLSDSAATECLSVELAQGQLWTMGVDLAKNISPSPITKRRILLPTYPFERKRYWLNARKAVNEVVSNLEAAQTNATTIVSHPTISSIRTTELLPMNAPTNASPHSPAAAVSRKPQLVSKLRTLFEDVSGADLSAVDTASSFIELGLDSLTLTQAAIQLKKAFNFKITFRQLMEQQRSFDALAAFLDAELPPEVEVLPAVMPAQISMPVAVPSQALASAAAPALRDHHQIISLNATSTSVSTVERVIQQQLHLMSQQLAMLGGGASLPLPDAATTNAPALPIALAADQASHAASPVAEAEGPMRYDVKKAFGAIARIHTQGNALTDRQLARLTAFMRRYVERTQKSKAYTVQHRPHLADPRVVNNFRPQTKEIIYQIVVERSKGARMWDIDGNEYVDALNGFGMSLFGWQPDFIQDAIHAQLDIGYEVGPMHPLAGEVAQMVCELTGFDRAGLCNTGSEAVMAAIRIARTVTGRSLMVVFSGSYHGTFDEVIVRAGRQNKGIPAAPGIMSEAFGNILVLDYGTPESLEIIRQHADDLAAVLVEPVQSRRPDFQPKEFLREVRSITEKSGTCLIFDEVITGFRSHPGGVQALFGIQADLGTYGKVVGGGYPIGVVAGKREYMDALDGGAWNYGDDSIPSVGVTYFAGTFVRHPLALAAAKAALTHMKQAGGTLQSSLSLSTAAMADELNAFCQEVGAPITIKNFASLWRATFDEEHPLQDLLFAMMRSRGVHILDNFPCFFTTAHTPDDVAIIKTAFKESVLELQEADLLPKRRDAPSKALDAQAPPVVGARIGKDQDGRPAWFVPNPNSPGKYLRLDS
jgi:amino acid adenylation domain-containing protein